MGNFSITVNAATNGAPTELGDKSITIASGATYVILTTDFTNTIPPYSDPENDDPAKVKITSLPTTGDLELSSVAVTLNQEILWSDIVAGDLEYIADSATTTLHTDNIEFDIADTGSNTFAGLTGNLNFTISAYVNQPPSSVGDNSDSISYGTVKTFVSADFTSGTTPAYADPESDAAQAIKILSLPANGSLVFDGSPVIVNQIIQLADISDLTFIANGATGGYVAVFRFAVSDAGSNQFVE